MSTKLIDISYWQGNLDFKSLNRLASIILFLEPVTEQLKILGLISTLKLVSQ